ncbi:amino acid adenylation domain-containing protein [Micromonospora sp. WMMD956]|uniref:non-ribosomal peptide synthetase n=1 Tax=Micromonospora sp. WMMD956 TaxID=3016108 RepID=UPI00241730B2|nr:amino acid adenylation domain-containing protein [Micromonospora sp. WMMD956]MDG4817654.1 amino acid adenylation domain-containing protein [Micromonospora sp. WMMD956]
MSIDNEPATADAAPYAEIVHAALGQVLRRDRIDPYADFFDLGGQSLQAVEVALELRRRTGIAVDLDLLFTCRRPVDVAAHLARHAPAARETPMSPTEERLLFLDRLHPGSPLYCVPVRYRFAGELDAEALRAALQDLVDRHEALRTCFTADGRRLVRSAAALPWTVVDLSGEEPARAAAEARRHVAEEARRPVPTDVPPLARACLVTEPGDRAVLLLTLHHLIADQHSLDLLDRQLQQSYGERVGLARDLPPLRRRGLAGRPDAAAARAHWRGQLAGLGGRMALPADRPRPDVVGPAGEVVTAPVDAALVARLTELAAACAASEFMVLLAAYAAFLARVAAQGGAAHAPVVVGAPLGGRTADDEDTVGMFVNVLPVRVRIGPDTTFRQLVAQVRGQVSAALAYQWTPLQELVADATAAAGPAGHPLTQVSISHVDDRAWHWAPAGATAARDVLSTGTAKYELLWTVTTGAASATSALEAAADLFTHGRAEELHGRLLADLALLSAAPDAPVAPAHPPAPAQPTYPAPPVASAPDRAAGRAPGGYVRQPADRPVHEVVAHRARTYPDAVAVRHGGKSLRYGELDAAAGGLAGHLVEAGVRPGDRVAVAAERGADAVTAFLAVLRAGAAYVPVDVAQPTARSRTILRDSGVRLALCQPGARGHVPAGVPTVDLAAALAGAADRPAPPPVPVTVRHPAYVMYTSGSTGTPKGVVVPHEAILRLVPRSNFLSLHPEDVVAHLSNTAFDAATLEVWGALCAGATLAVVPREVALSPHRMGRFLADTGVSVMFTTNALLNAIVAHVPDAFAGLRVLLIGGDQYALEPVRRMLAAGAPQHLVNAYGPTENTTFSAAHEVTAADLDRGVLPIGGAIDGTYLRVLDDRLAPVAPGGAGELYVGGQGLADGYVGDPGRTSAAFVADPYAADPFAVEPGARLYRTGDLVRLLPDGGVVFLGRRDDQVKVSGFRVELGEVERVLGDCPGVGECAVLAVADADAVELVAVLTGPADPGEVREFLRANLPAYMVPARCHRVRRLPTTNNGKVDRPALLAELGRAAASVPDPAPTPAGVASVDPVAAGLADIWRDLLGIADVNADSHFFALGGTSIKALHLVGAVHRRFGVDLRIVTVFRRPAFADLAREITDLAGVAADPAREAIDLAGESTGPAGTERRGHGDGPGRP